MSHPPNRSFDLPNQIHTWLQSLQGKSPAPEEQAHPLPQTADLLKKAAQCYATAGWAEDACRLFDTLDDPRAAAPFHERQGNWEQAARCYAQCGEWLSAARCYESAHQAAQAAECFLKAGQILQAAWIWAHQVHHFHRAEVEVNAISANSDFDSDFDNVAIQLVLSRCEAGTGAKTSATKRLVKGIEQMRTLPANVTWRQLYDWAIAVATVLHRPDLTVSLYATAAALNVSGLQENWEQWSIEVLGDATGVVVPDKFASRNGENEP